MKPLRPNPSHFVTFYFSFSWCGERETFSDLRGRRFSRVCFSKLRSTCWSKSLLHNFDLSCEVFGSIIQVHVKMYLFDLLIEKIADLLFSRACHFKNSQDNCFQISCTCSPYQKSEMMQLSNAYLISTRGTKNQLTKFGVYLGCFDLSILLTIWIARFTFDGGTEDLAVKPYILQKIQFQWICCKCLAW